MTPFTFAQLPEIGYVVLACIVVGLIAIVGIGVAMRFGRELRSGLAAELKQEIAAQREASPVAVQQPLVVAAHQESVTRAELDKVDTQLHGRIKRERAEIDDRITRVEQAATVRADKLEAKLDANTNLTSQMGGEVKQINQNVQLILNSLAQK